MSQMDQKNADSWIDLACRIAENRREAYISSVRANGLAHPTTIYYEKKLKDPPLCLTDEEIRMVRQTWIQ